MRILVVDDDKMVLEFFKARLGNKHLVLGEINPALGLETLEDARIDVVLVDYNMPPYMHGDDFLFEARIINNKTPVCLISNDPSMSKDISAYDMQVEKYKLFQYDEEAMEEFLKELHAKVRNV